MYYNNGDKYDGEWKNDLREGKGIMKYNNGDIYDGYWKNDKKDGKGIMINNNGDKYDGYWKNNLREGKGFLMQNNVKYEVNWKNDKMIGEAHGQIRDISIKKNDNCRHIVIIKKQK